MAENLADRIAEIINKKPDGRYYLAISITTAMALLGIFAITYSILNGLGGWGINDSVVWGVSIVNFVFWIGIGHAGTLISAILFLLNQRWRSSINRSAEAMTIFAVICAAIFPLVHTGRQWLSIYCLIPYPSQMRLWVNFSSPIIWDLFAIGTYFTISLIFWYIGMMPDLSIIKSDIKSQSIRKVYNYLSLGWQGTGNQWRKYNLTYLLLAGLATPLVLSVHTIVSFDFSPTLVQGWHSTIFPPYFVAGAIFSGCATVIILSVLTRQVLDIKDIIQPKHLDKVCKLMLTTSLMIAYAYFFEIYRIWYGGSPIEDNFIFSRLNGENSFIYYLMVLFNVIIPQLLWFRKFRKSIPIMLVIAILVDVGMWLERYDIIIGSLHWDYLPSSWTIYTPGLLEISIFIGTIGLFFTLYLLFLKFVPVVSVTELKTDEVNQSEEVWQEQEV